MKEDHVEREQLRSLEMSVEQVFKLVLTMGIADAEDELIQIGLDLSRKLIFKLV